jgi:hypothetical protein
MGIHKNILSGFITNIRPSSRPSDLQHQGQGFFNQTQPVRSQNAYDALLAFFNNDYYRLEMSQNNEVLKEQYRLLALLRKLDAKVQDLQHRSEPCQEAAIAADSLLNKLSDSFLSYLKSDQSPAELEYLRKNCHEDISQVQPILTKHRGYLKEGSARFLLSLTGVGLFYILLQLQVPLTRTESRALLDELRQGINAQITGGNGFPLTI